MATVPIIIVQRAQAWFTVPVPEYQGTHGALQAPPEALLKGVLLVC